jgi:PBSX family phage terminase large subunit
MEFTPHSHKQEQAIFSEKKITLCGTGIQWGKTRVGAVRMKQAMHTFTEKDDAFIIVAPTYKIMQQSTLPAFKALNQDIWEKNYSAAAGEFRMPGGGVCYFRTSTDPDSVVGITKVRHIWGDEANKFSLLFWENLQARSSFMDCPIDLTTSPYSLNWTYKELIRPKMRDPSARPDCLWINASSEENPYFPKHEFDRKKVTMDPRRFKMIYGGQWDRPAGLVYDCFDEDLNQCEPFQYSPGTKFYGGLDWGYTEHFAFTIRAVTPGGAHFGISEVYRTSLDIEKQSEEVAAKCRTFPVETIYADPSQPGSISYMNRYLKGCGLKAGVVAANNDKRLGIDAHYGLIKTKRLKYVRGMMPHTLDELDSYHYAEPKDLNPDDKAKDMLPVEQKDHLMDAERYVSLATHENHKRKAPTVPNDKPKHETPHELVERLKRKPRVNHSEDWAS